MISICSAAASASRSARRQTARATCSRAASSVPPGRTKLFSSGSSALTRSQSCSSAVDLLLGDAQPVRRDAVRDGEVGAEVEQLVLDARRAPAALSVEVAGEHEPDLRVELVDRRRRRAIRQSSFDDARAVAEARLALVAAARVDPRQADRLVALAGHTSRLR